MGRTTKLPLCFAALALAIHAGAFVGDPHRCARSLGCGTLSGKGAFGPSMSPERAFYASCERLPPGLVLEPLRLELMPKRRR